MSTPTGSGYSDLPIQSLGNVLSTGWGPDATSGSLGSVLQGAFGLTNISQSTANNFKAGLQNASILLEDLLSHASYLDSYDRGVLNGILENVVYKEFNQYFNPFTSNTLFDYVNLANGDLSKLLNSSSPPAAPTTLNGFISNIVGTYSTYLPLTDAEYHQDIISAPGDLQNIGIYNPNTNPNGIEVYNQPDGTCALIFYMNHVPVDNNTNAGPGRFVLTLPKFIQSAGINFANTANNNITPYLVNLLQASGDASIGNDAARYAFQDFLASNPLKNYNGVGSVGDYFKTQFTQFINNYHLATYNPVAPLVAQNATASDVALNFQDVFNAFFTDPTGQDYSHELQAFLTQIVSTTGDRASVLPSASLKEWLSDVQNKYQIALYGANGAKSTVAGTFYKVDIINRILTLLTSILGTLQSMTASQAGNLTVLARWQQAYTEQQSKISFNVSSISDTQQQTNAINQRSQFVSMIQTKRSLVQDSAKALQSAVNQSNDTTSQQANLLSALLQQLSTILSAIYR